MAGESDVPLVYRCSRWWLRLLFLSYWQPQTTGEENVPSTGPLLLVCNHPTVLDGLVLGSVLNRRVRFLISREPLRIPLVGPWLLALGFIPTGGAQEAALSRLHQGACVGVFPEAVPTHSYRLHPFHPGFATLARRSGATVVPVTISGTEELCPQHCSYVPGGSVHLQFGEPLRWEADDSVEGFVHRVRQRIERGLDCRPVPPPPRRNWRYRLSQLIWTPSSWLLLKLADWTRPGGKR